MKQVEVTILGQSYILGCPDDGEAELLQAVAMVDREMSAIRDAGKIKARERMAVLAALNLAYRLAERATAVASGAASSVASGVQTGAVAGAGIASAGGASGAAAGAGSAAVAGAVAGAAPGEAASASAQDPDVAALVSRLDAMLAQDGRLL